MGIWSFHNYKIIALDIKRTVCTTVSSNEMHESWISELVEVTDTWASQSREIAPLSTAEIKQLHRRDTKRNVLQTWNFVPQNFRRVKLYLTKNTLKEGV